MFAVLAAATLAQTTVYDSVPAILAPNYPSVGFQATSTRELGDYVHLAGTDRLAKTVTITMSDWALQATPANVAYCAANPGTCSPAGFNHPFTLSFYNVIPGAPLNTKGSLIGRITQTKFVPWRPVADPTCPGGTAWRAPDTLCYNGYAFNMTFDLSGLYAVLPNDLIVAIEYNTQSYGPAPLGVDGPYNSLNVATNPGPAAVGTDDSLDRIFFSSTWSGAYTDNGAGGLGLLREDTAWTGYGTIPIKITAGAPPAAQIINASLGDPLANPNAWFIYNDETDTINNSLGSMVNGPGTPPIGTGSAQISVSGTQRRNLATYQFSGTPLSALGTLRFSTYNPSAGNGGSPNRSGYLHFNVDFNGSDTWQRRLVYVPSQNGTVIQNTWQEWDAINGGNAQWSYSGATWPAGIGEPGTTPGTTLKTWNQILATYPGVRMRVTDSFFGIRVGEPYADGYTENIDAIKVGIPAYLKHFNFDVLPPVTYVDDNWVGTTPGTDPDGAGPATSFGYDAFATIQGGIDGVAPSGTVNVAGGTYNESVLANKTVSLLGAGAGASTIVGPYNSGGPDTLLITAGGVLVDGFTITRNGNTVATWAANVKNQGVNISSPATGTTLQNCTFTGNRNAIYVGQSSNGNTIRRNVIDNNRTGVHMVDNNGPNLIEENYITNNWTMGVLIRTENGVPQGLATVRNNNITGNWYSEIEYRDPVSGGLQNFSGNYLGSTITRVTVQSGEPGYTSQIPVTFGGSATPPPTHPTIAGPESAKVDYSPYLNFGGDTQVGTPGFQGNYSSLTVTADAAHVAPPTSRVQEGIDLMSSPGILTIPTATYPGNVDVNKAITVKGTFTVGGTFTVSSAGATLSPGYSPGIVNTGNFSLVSGSNLNIELNGNVAGALYDQVNVTGTVSLGGTNLVTTVGYAPTTGHTYTIINNDGADPVTGTFAGLPNNTVFYVGPNAFRINYDGGTGNDVVLTAVAPCNTVSIPTNITSLTGNTNVVVPINVDDTTGNGLLSTDFRVTYNPAVLTLTAVNLGTVTAGATLTTNGTPGSMTVSIFRTTPFTGAGTLANLTFTAVGAPGTSSPVSFASFMFNEGTSCISTSNGLVTILSGTITGTVTYGNVIGSPVGPRYVPDVTLNAVGSVNVSASTGPAVSTGQYTLSGMGAGAYTVTPSKVGGVAPLGLTITTTDSAEIAKHVVNIITLNATQLTVADVSGTGGVTSFDAALIARWATGLTGYGSTAQWRFTPVNRSYPNVNTDQTAQDYTVLLMGDVTGNWHQGLSPARPAPVEDENAIAVKAESASAASGTVVSIPVSVDDTTRRGIVSYQLEIRYNPAVLEPTADPIDLSGSISDGMVATVNPEEPGFLRVSVFGPHALTGKGGLFKMNFNVIGPAESSSDLQFNTFFFNEGEIGYRTVNGVFTVSAANSDGTISGRVVTPFGRGLRGTRVTVTDINGGDRSVLTNGFGYFEVSGLEVGHTYTVRAVSRQYRFTPQTVSLDGNAVTLELIADQ